MRVVLRKTIGLVVLQEAISEKQLV